jgi:hypothetical protein
MLSFDYVIYYVLYIIVLYYIFNSRCSLHANAGIVATLKLSHVRLLADPFQFIIYVSPFNSIVYSLTFWKSVVK